MMVFYGEDSVVLYIIIIQQYTVYIWACLNTNNKAGNGAVSSYIILLLYGMR